MLSIQGLLICSATAKYTLLLNARSTDSTQQNTIAAE